MSNLKILTLNCRGLGDKNKRKDVFGHLREKNFSIYCIQDTHFTKKDLKYIRAQWGYNIFISPGTSDSRGVAILLNNNFEHKVINEDTDEKGNLMELTLEIENKYTITLISIYGPNKDTPQFYVELNERLSKSEADFTILCGDFNLVQNTDLDYYNYKGVNNPKAREELIKLKQEHKLQDPWRILHPQHKRYTWSRNTPIKRARLDFFLITEELMGLVERVDIQSGYLTDHNSVEIELKLNNFTKGKGFWKFNNSLLKDREYVKKVKETIKEVKNKYAALTYNREIINPLPAQELHLTINDQLFF